MRRGPLVWWMGLVAVVGLLLAGCGDSNLFESQSDSSGDAARLEAGLAAIDSENWDQAIEIFSAMDPTDPDVMKYLSSAYIGKAGFDTLALVDAIAEAEDNEDAGDIIYDSITSIFDEDGDGIISAEDLGDKADLIEQALAVFGITLPDGGARLAAAVDLSGLTDEQIFQAGLYAAVHAVLSVVAQLEEPGNPGNLLLTLDELRMYPAVIDSVSAPSSLDDDLAVVRAAIQVLGDEEGDNDIADELDVFLTDLGYLPDEHVDDTDLQNYLAGLL